MPCDWSDAAFQRPCDSNSRAQRERPAYIRPAPPPSRVETRIPYPRQQAVISVPMPRPRAGEMPVIERLQPRAERTVAQKPPLPRAECAVPTRVPVPGYVVVVYKDFAPTTEVSAHTQCAAAYFDGRLLSQINGKPIVGYASTGTAGKNETPETDSQKSPLGQEVVWADRHHRSTIYDDASKPYSLFFNGDIALHQGDTRQSRLSHGCVRLSEELAASLWELHGQASRAKQKFRVIVTTDEVSLLEKFGSTSYRVDSQNSFAPRVSPLTPQ